MAAPTYGAAGTYRQGSSAAPAFAVPASVVSSSIIVIDFYLDVGATISSLPTGFAHAAGSPLTVNPGGGGEHKLCRIWARGEAGSGGFYTVNLSANVYSNGQASRVDGCVASGDPWDTNSGTGAAAATATDVLTGVSPAVSMTTQNADQLLWFSGTNWSGGNWTPPTAGGTWTERLDTGDKTLTVDTLPQATAGATGSVTATCASADRRAALLGSLLSTALGGGGTTYNQAVSGAITPAGTLVRQTAKRPAGSITPTGALTRQTGKRPAGAATPTGALLRSTAKRPAGTVTPAGALQRLTAKTFAGAVTPAGTLATLKAAVRLFSGAIAPAGTLTRRTAKALTGTVAPSGSVRRAVAKTFAGTLGAAGTLAKQTAKRFLGALTPSGAVATSTGPPPTLRDLHLALGPPEAHWTAGALDVAWHAGPPELRWTTGPPEV